LRCHPVLVWRHFVLGLLVSPAPLFPHGCDRLVLRDFPNMVPFFSVKVFDVYGLYPALCFSFLLNPFCFFSTDLFVHILFFPIQSPFFFRLIRFSLSLPFPPPVFFPNLLNFHFPSPPRPPQPPFLVSGLRFFLFFHGNVLSHFFTPGASCPTPHVCNFGPPRIVFSGAAVRVSALHGFHASISVPFFLFLPSLYGFPSPKSPFWWNIFPTHCVIQPLEN